MKKILLVVALLSIQYAHAQQLDPQQLTNLNLTGQFWTFLKYHHPAVTAGKYDWDSALIKLLPSVMAASTNAALSQALEQFLDQLPVPDACKKCAAIDKLDYVGKPDYGDLLDGSVLDASITQKLVYIKNNRSTGENYYVKYGGAYNPDFQHEQPYADMTYPSLEYRLIAVYRYWGMVNYFFPSRYLTTMPWKNVLPYVLPYFVNAKTDQEYAVALLRLVTSLDDSHAVLFGQGKPLVEYRGKYMTPFKATFIEGKLVVTDLHTDTLDIKQKLALGDVITEINDRPVADLVNQYLPLVAGSNKDVKLRDMPFYFLLRSKDEHLKLTLDRQGNIFTYVSPMVDLSWASRSSNWKNFVPYKLLNDSIGYVYPGKYKNEMLPDIEKTFAGKKGMVIDMRTYPGEFMPYTFGNYLKKKKTSFAQFSCMTIDYPGAFRPFAAHMMNGGKKNAFTGKVIVIVNATTQSQAEYTTMAFQSSPNVKVLGSTTSGADGDVSTIAFPGGLSTYISGLGVYYPDNTQTQRVGVKIDYEVRPTIKGITEGRDELMEKALELLQ